MACCVQWEDFLKLCILFVQLIRAVAPSPAGPAMVSSSETGFLKIKAKHFKTVSDLGGRRGH